MTNAIVTGCDDQTEWMLPWFLANYRQFNNEPIIFCDFGVTGETLKWCEANFDEVVQHVPAISNEAQVVNGLRWYLKPFAMYLTDNLAHNRVWIDTDCEVLGDLSGIFEALEENKLSMVRDNPWSKIRGETWHNSGVFGLVGKPKILLDWYMSCREDSNKYSLKNVPRGDQDVLHDILGQDPSQRMQLIKDLPNIYNWLRIQLNKGDDNPDKLIMHWTGLKGKIKIKSKMRDKGFL